jgi:hypothetical protein
VQERANVDHYWPLTGTQVSDLDAGKHRRIVFQAPLGAAPTLEADEGTVYPYTVGGITELYWKDENGNVKQLTTAGKLNVTSTEAVLPTGDQSIGGTKTFTGTVVIGGAMTVNQNTDIGDYQLRAKTFYSDVATGTAPLTVTSTTKVTNLNADQVDGKSFTSYDSGWFAVSNNTTYTKAHGLGVFPTVLNVYYSDTADGSGDVVLVGNGMWNASAVSMVCDVDATYIKVRCPAFVVDYLDASGVRHYPTTGYMKVTAILVN